jgi:hypothetical protein
MLGKDKVCGCPHHKMVPFFIILIGVTFLMRYFGAMSQMMVDLVWPILLILIGLQKMMSGVCRCCSK